MGLFSALVERRALEQTFVDNPAEWLVQMFGGRSSATGLAVTPATALEAGPVFACVRVLAETIASLPLLVYRRLADDGRERVPEHYLYPVLHIQPNPEQTSLDWREQQQGHLTLRGNAYSEIVRDGAGRVRQLWPLHPDKMRVERGPDGAIQYVYTLPTGQSIDGKSTAVLRADQVLHLRALALDGVMGTSPIAAQRETVGLTLALQEFGARFFGNGAMPGGTLKTPGKLSDPTYARLKADWAAAHQGLSNAHRVAILEEGLEWQQIGLQNEHAQFIQSRNFQVGDIARLFRVPGVLIGYDDKTSTYASAEQFFLSFVVHTIRPWLVRWEQALMVKLLSPVERERGGIFIEHAIEGLLRGDLKSRYDAYAVGRNWGWLSADDIRRIENMNALPDGQGQHYLVPLNMVPAGTVPTTKERVDAVGGLVRAGFDPVESLDAVGLPPITHTGILPVTAQPQREPAPEAPAAGASGSAAARAALLLSDAINRAVRRELEAARTAATKHAGDPTAWRAWVDGFYARHAAYLSESLRVNLEAAQRYAQEHRAELLAEGVAVLDRWAIEAAGELVELACLEEVAA